MIKVIGNGILTGLILMTLVGPSFFYLVKVGVRKGFQQAFAFALGIFISDVLLILLIVLGLAPLFKSVKFQELFSLLAGIVLLVIGILTLRKEMRSVKEEINDMGEVSSVRWWQNSLKGFGLNVMNPFTVLMWIGVLSAAGVQLKYEGNQLMVYLTAVLITVLCADALKAFVAGALSRFLTARVLQWMHRGLSLLFLLAGFYFLWRYITL